MSSAQLYDTIGATYTVTRRTEPRIAARIWGALGDARTVLNVGAGTGSYEPPGRDVAAVEPSAVMRAQRPAGAAPCVAAAAESLPFEDQSFDAAMAFSTVHHWQDPIAGLREMRRVARRVVVFTYDASDTGWRRRFWLTRDYLPEVADFNVGRPSLTEQARAIGARMEPVLIPWDCADGFFEAYWRRPEAYLDDGGGLDAAFLGLAQATGKATSTYRGSALGWPARAASSTSARTRRRCYSSVPSPRATSRSRSSRASCGSSVTDSTRSSSRRSSTGHSPGRTPHAREKMSSTSPSGAYSGAPPKAWS